MALSRFVLPFADVGSGIRPSSGAQLFFLETGTSTPANTYNCPDGTTANSNPVIADSKGLFPDIFLSGTFKVILQDRNDVQQWEADPVEFIRTSEDVVDRVDTVVALRLLEPSSDGQTVSLVGHTLAGIGGGDFYYDESDTTSADNNGTVIVTAGGKRWKRPDVGEVSGSWFGMDLTGATDDTLLMQAAVNTGQPVTLTRGSYMFANIIPDAPNAKLIVRGDGSSETIINVPTGYSGYIFNTTGSYDLRGMVILGEEADGQYAIGDNGAGNGGGQPNLYDVRMFGFEQMIRFGDEYEHPLGLKYDRVYCQNFSVAGINLGGTTGVAGSGESAWDFPNVIVTNPTNSPVEYAETTQNNVPSATQDTISWSGDAPEFGYLVLRSLDDSTNWEICPNWESSNYTSTTFEAKKESGQTWFYKVIRMTVGINVRRSKVVNFGATQTEYTGIGIRLSDVTAFNIASSYYEIRQSSLFKGGFAGVYASESIGQVGSAWGEELGYNVFVANNSRVSISSIRSSNGIIAVIGNTGATDQVVTYENIRQGNTPLLYSSPNNGAQDFNYEGTDYTTNKNVRRISHVTEAAFEVDFRGINKGALKATSEGATISVNALDLRINNKTMTPLVVNEVGTNVLTDAVATSFLTLSTVGSNGSGSIRLHYKIRVLDGSSVTRQTESGWLDIDSLNVANTTPEVSVQESSTNQRLNAGTLTTTFTATSGTDLITVLCNAASSQAGSIRLEITPISVIGNIEVITQL